MLYLIKNKNPYRSRFSLSTYFRETGKYRQEIIIFKNYNIILTTRFIATVIFALSFIKETLQIKYNNCLHFLKGNVIYVSMINTQYCSLHFYYIYRNVLLHCTFYFFCQYYVVYPCNYVKFVSLNIMFYHRNNHIVSLYPSINGNVYILFRGIQTMIQLIQRYMYLCDICGCL